jgi:hypothetical protein
MAIGFPHGFPASFPFQALGEFSSSLSSEFRSFVPADVFNSFLASIAPGAPNWVGTSAVIGIMAGFPLLLKRTRFSKSIFPVCLTLAAVSHGALLGKGCLDFRKSQEMKERYDQKQRDLDLEIENSGLSAERKEVLRIEHAAVKKRNAPRIERAQRLREKAEALKEEYLAGPRFTPEFVFRYEELWEGVPPKIVGQATKVFDGLIDQLRGRVRQGRPDLLDLGDIVAAFGPAGPQEDTIAHASDALVLRSSGIVANCDSKSVLNAMGLTALYPGIGKDLYVQEFGDHVRLLYLNPETKETRILEGEVAIFPDAKTSETVSRVLPLSEYWRSVFGIPEDGLKGVSYFGPQPSENEPLILTDRIHSLKSEPTRKLGVYGSTEKNVPEERGEELGRVERQLESVAKYGEVLMEGELFETRLSAQGAEAMVASRDFSRLRASSEIDPEALKILLSSAEYRKQTDDRGYEVGLGITGLTEDFIQAMNRMALSAGPRDFASRGRQNIGRSPLGEARSRRVQGVRPVGGGGAGTISGEGAAFS